MSMTHYMHVGMGKLICNIANSMHMSIIMYMYM